MNTERLTKLREAVEKAPLEHFKMDVWTCGTAACAAGWYVKENPGCGLVLIPDSHAGNIATEGKDPNTEYPDWALGDHFGIPEKQASLLFMDWNEREPEAQKAEFLRKLARVMVGDELPDPCPDDDEDDEW